MYVANVFFLHLFVFLLLLYKPLQTVEDPGAESGSYWDNHSWLFSLALVIQPRIALLFFSSIPWTAAFVVFTVLFPEVTAISLFFERGYHHKHFLLLIVYSCLAFFRHFKWNETPPPRPTPTVNEDGTISLNVAPEIFAILTQLARSITSLCMLEILSFSLRSTEIRTAAEFVVFATM